MQRRTLVLIFGTVISAMVISLSAIRIYAIVWNQEEQDRYCNNWARIQKEVAEKYPDINKTINWQGEAYKKESPLFTQEERKALVEYIHERPSGYRFDPTSIVFKEDLDNDGNKEYIATLIIKPAQPFHCGEVAGVIMKNEGGFKILELRSPILIKSGLVHSFQFVDLDGDGLKEIVEETVQQEDPENPTYEVFYSVIYKNDNMTFYEIYRRLNYYSLRFMDLNADGRMEILETRNETPLKPNPEDPERVPMQNMKPEWQWVNVYEWDGVKLQQVNEKHPPFYLEQQKSYRDLLEKAKEEVESRRKKKWPTIASEEAIETMKSYIDRIEKMKTGNKPGPP